MTTAEFEIVQILTKIRDNVGDATANWTAVLNAWYQRAASDVGGL